MRSRASVARAAALVGSAALLAAAIAAFVPVEGLARGRPRRAVVCDLSGSACARHPDGEARLVGLATAALDAARARGELATAIVFGAGVQRVEAEALRPGALALDPSGSALDGALQAARDWLGDAGLRSIELVADGGYTGADPRPRLAALAAEGVGVEWSGLPPRERSELVLGEPRAGEARAGAPVAIRLPLALLRADGDAAPRRLSIEIAGVRSTRTLEPPPGSALDESGWLHWALDLELPPLPEGGTRVRFALEGAAGERVIELHARGSAPRAAVLGALAGLAEQPGGPRWIPVDGASLARELESFDLVLSGDRSWSELPAEALRAWVQRGGAWIACAAPANFPHDWGWAALADLLPLEPAGTGLPPREVILLVDGSGSMSGEPWEIARAALERLGAAAGGAEVLRARVFAATLGPALALEARALPARAPGGPTALLDALEALAAEPAALERLVVLLSDGRDRGGEQALERARALAPRLAAARVALAAIAIGAQADLELLRALCSPGQELLLCPALTRALQASELEALFRRQLGARGWARDVSALGVASRAGEPALDSLAAALAPLRLARALPRCAALHARSGAAELLVTPTSAPALALARRGLGWCAAVGFDPGAAEFTAEVDPWATLAGFVARADRAGPPRLFLEAGRLWVEDAPQLARGWGEATLLPRAAGEAAERLRLVEREPGRWSAALDAQQMAGSWRALRLDPSSGLELELPWPVSLAPEERLPRTGLAAAERRAWPASAPAEARGGGVLARVLLALGLGASFAAAALGFFSRAGARA